MVPGLRSPAGRRRGKKLAAADDSSGQVAAYALPGRAAACRCGPGRTARVVRAAAGAAVSSVAIPVHGGTLVRDDGSGRGRSGAGEV